MRLALQSTLSMHARRSRRAGSESGYSTRMSNSSLTLREERGSEGGGGRMWERGVKGHGREGGCGRVWEGGHGRVGVGRRECVGGGHGQRVWEEGHGRVRGSAREGEDGERVWEGGHGRVWEGECGYEGGCGREGMREGVEGMVGGGCTWEDPGREE